MSLKIKIKFLTIALLIVFSIPAISSLFHPGFFQSDDGEWMIIRFSAFYQALADGQFPVRFLGRLNHEYGYTVSNFLYPWFMYLGVPIHLLGFGFVDTIKIIFGVSMISSAVFSFLWLSKFFDKFSSFIGSLFYLYTPYHLFDLYKRGSVGEVLALAVVPFILWQIERRSLFWTSIGIAALIVSHNTLAVLFLGFLILYMVLDIYVSKEKKEILRKYLYILLFGLGISAFFWIPAIYELQYTVFSEIKISEIENYFASISLVGVSSIFVLIVTSIVSLYKVPPLQRCNLDRTVFFIIFGILSLMLSTNISEAFWNLFPFLSSIVQFPFRILSITILSTAFLSAFLVDCIRQMPQKLSISFTLIFILGFSALPYIKPSEFFDKGEGFYATNMGTTTVQDEYMPKWVKELPKERTVEKVEIVDKVEEIGKAMPVGRQVENVSYNSKKITFNVNVQENAKARVNTIYYPGWNAKINSQNAVIDYSNEKGVMELVIPKGENVVELTFSETPLRQFADFFSLFCFIALIFISKSRSPFFTFYKE